MAQDIFLDAEIVGDDGPWAMNRGSLMVYCPRSTVLHPFAPRILLPVISLFACDFPNHIPPVETAPFAGQFQQFISTGSPRRESCILCAAIAELAGQPAGIHTRDAGNAIMCQPIRQGSCRSPV